MSEPQNITGNEENAGAGGGKKSFKKIIIIFVVLLLAGGGGFYYWRSKSAASNEETQNEKSEKSKSDKKSKAKKSDDDSEEEEEDTKKPKKSGPLKNSLPNDENVKKVIDVPAFIVNLADSENARYLRMTVNLGIGGDSDTSEKPDQLFLTRVRNAMLEVLSQKRSDELLTAEGKSKLRKELLKAAQDASEEPHVEAIYITEFIVQL